MGDRHQQDITFTNPILPGWNSDPSWIFVPEFYDTYFCVVSSFMTFPGLPLYASKDLRSWKLVSNIFNRPSQVPQLRNDEGQSNGIYAPTLRYHDRSFYVLVEYVKLGEPPKTFGLIFTSKNPYESAAWSDPILFHHPTSILDPDIFWDDDGTQYVQAGAFSQEIIQFPLDIKTGVSGPIKTLWKGTGEIAPEGPHLFKKDGWYYLIIAEGGTGDQHCVQIARSKSPTGPFQGNEKNPILTNRGTFEYFQTVGHADFLEDKLGNWWAVALATRRGLSKFEYPMGRETVLTPVSWNEDGWPSVTPVRGQMAGWPLPPRSRSVPGQGSFHGDPDTVDFAPGTELPLHFLHWRFPPENTFLVSPPEHPNSLRINPSKANLAGGSDLNPSHGIALVARRQTDTLFNYSVDIIFEPSKIGEEAGVTVFLTQLHHISFGIILLPLEGTEKLVKHVRFHIQCSGNESLEQTTTTPLPEAWTDQPIRLTISTVTEIAYSFSAALVETHLDAAVISCGTAPVRIVSGGSGPYSGALVGVFATSNGGTCLTPAYVKNWRYEGQGQRIGSGLGDILYPKCGRSE